MSCKRGIPGERVSLGIFQQKMGFGIFWGKFQWNFTLLTCNRTGPVWYCILSHSVVFFGKSFFLQIYFYIRGSNFLNLNCLLNWCFGIDFASEMILLLITIHFYPQYSFWGCFGHILRSEFCTTLFAPFEFNVMSVYKVYNSVHFGLQLEQI